MAARQGTRRLDKKSIVIKHCLLFLCIVATDGACGHAKQLRGSHRVYGSISISEKVRKHICFQAKLNFERDLFDLL